MASGSFFSIETIFLHGPLGGGIGELREEVVFLFGGRIFFVGGGRGFFVGGGLGDFVGGLCDFE